MRDEILQFRLEFEERVQRERRKMGDDAIAYLRSLHLKDPAFNRKATPYELEHLKHIEERAALEAELAEAGW